MICEKRKKTSWVWEFMRDAKRGFNQELIPADAFLYRLRKHLDSETERLWFIFFTHRKDKKEKTLCLVVTTCGIVLIFDPKRQRYWSAIEARETKKYYLNLHDHKIPFLYVTTAFIFFPLRPPSCTRSTDPERTTYWSRRWWWSQGATERTVSLVNIFSCSFPTLCSQKKGLRVSSHLDSIWWGYQKDPDNQITLPTSLCAFLSPTLLFYHSKHMFLFFILFLSSTRSKREKKIHPLPSRFSGNKAITQRRSSSRPQEGFFSTWEVSASKKRARAEQRSRKRLHRISQNLSNNSAPPPPFGEFYSRKAQSFKCPHNPHHIQWTRRLSQSSIQ